MHRQTIHQNALVAQGFCRAGRSHGMIAPGSKSQCIACIERDFALKQAKRGTVGDDRKKIAR